MEHTNEYHNLLHRHSATGSMMPDFCRSMLPELLLQNNLSQNPVSTPNLPSTNPSMPGSPAINSPSSLQALENSISSLKLLDNGIGEIGGGRRLNSAIGASAHGSHVSFENYMHQSKNPRIDVGVGHRSFPPDVGSERFGIRNPTALFNEPRYSNGGFTSCSYLDQIMHTRSFLQSKKEWPSPHLSPNLPVLPSSNSSSNSYLDSSSGFRSNKPIMSPMDQYYCHINGLSLKELKEMIVPLAKDSFACGILQNKLDRAIQDEIDMVLSLVYKDVGDLMMNEFGKLFMQKLIVVSNVNQITLLILSVTESPFHLMNICLHQFGAESFKKLLEHVTAQQQISLIMRALGTCAAVLAIDPNGHRIIQHCLLNFSSHENQGIIIDIASHCFTVATHRSGCCVVQTCVVHALPGFREQILGSIISSAVQLAEDPYGNYVLQHMLGLRIREATAQLVQHLRGYYETLSCNKFGSHVVEKCLTESSEDESNGVIRELLSSPNVSSLFNHPFGNFVIQSALSVAKGYIRNELLNKIQMNAPILKNNIYGKKLLDRYDRSRLYRF